MGFFPGKTSQVINLRLTSSSTQNGHVPPALSLVYVLLQQRRPLQSWQREDRRYGCRPWVQRTAILVVDFAVLCAEWIVRFAAEYVDGEVEWEGYVAEL